MKYEFVFKKSLSDELRKRGHNFLYERKNIKNERYFVYVFEQTVDLLTDMHKLKNAN